MILLTSTLVHPGAGALVAALPVRFPLVRAELADMVREGKAISAIGHPATAKLLGAEATRMPLDIAPGVWQVGIKLATRVADFRAYDRPAVAPDDLVAVAGWFGYPECACGCGGLWVPYDGEAVQLWKLTTEEIVFAGFPQPGCRSKAELATYFDVVGIER
jgi:hypothetical protein